MFCLYSGGAKPSSVGLTEPRAVLNALAVEGGRAISGYPSRKDTWPDCQIHEPQGAQSSLLSISPPPEASETAPHLGAFCPLPPMPGSGGIILLRAALLAQEQES